MGRFCFKVQNHKGHRNIIKKDQMEIIWWKREQQKKTEGALEEIQYS